MQNRKPYRIFLALACLVVAGMSLYKILGGDYTWVDVVLMVAGLIFGILYFIRLRKEV
ncbi:hypothetical protein [Pontibacter arcticus]|uniref:hypothetical protein n=1 Tax=Pontibacter arcticus TaxID=2080288 RepID=UPI001402243E|nr:hypothetical protein [Pontibacter arcticus]